MWIIEKILPKGMLPASGKFAAVGLFALAAALQSLVGTPAWAQSPAQSAATPNFFDQRQRSTKPDLGERARIRFLTTTDYPPFNFLDPRGRLIGFNVDLVRAICKELGISDRCQIEAVAFDDLLPTLEKGDAEAIVAGLSMTTNSRRDLVFTEPYFRYPARFVTLKSKALASPVAEYVAGKTVGVQRGSAHAAMLAAFFPGVSPREFASPSEGLAALKSGGIDAWFGDGVSLAFWLESEGAGDCCSFSDGPFLSDRFLGEGLAIAVAPNDAALARSIDYAIGQIVEKDEFSDLLLRYFPISAF